MAGWAGVLILGISVFLASLIAKSTAEIGTVVITSGWSSYRDGVRISNIVRGASITLTNGRVFGPDVHSYWTSIFLITFFIVAFGIGASSAKILKRYLPVTYERLVYMLNNR
jgi:hypothetical protein